MSGTPNFSMEASLGILTVVFGLVLGLAYRHIMQQIGLRENSLLNEIQILGNLLEESESNIENLLSSLPQQMMPDALEQMEIMRAGILNNLMNLGVQFVGKKFGLDMGVHQIEESEPAGFVESAVSTIYEE